MHSDRLDWRTSACVEVVALAGGDVAVHDTKDRTCAPHRYSAAAWRAFLAGVSARGLDR